MPLPDLQTYLLDEAASIKAYTFTPADIATAKALLQQIKDDQHPAYRWLSNRLADLGCASVLDLGCGLGEQWDAIRKYQPQIAYTGCDVWGWFVQQAQARLPNAAWVQVDQFFSLPWGDNTFDAVLIRSALNFYGPVHGAQILTEALRVAKKGIAVQVYLPPEDNAEIVAYTNHRGSTRGYTIQWTKAQWAAWLQGKNWAWEQVGTRSANILVVRK